MEVLLSVAVTLCPSPPGLGGFNSLGSSVVAPFTHLLCHRLLLLLLLQVVLAVVLASLRV